MSDTLAEGYVKASEAIEDLVSFLLAFTEPRLLRGAITAEVMTNDEVQRFLQYDERLYLALHAIGLRDELPSIDVLARELDSPGGRPYPRVQFIGKCNLPGDWEDGIFMFGTDRWLEEMRPLRELLRHPPTHNRTSFSPKTAPSETDDSTPPEWKNSSLTLDERAKALFVAKPELLKTEMAKILECHPRIHI